MTFYTEERLRNWVNRINEQELDFESAESFDVFDKMIEDFVVACMYLIRSVKDREISKKDALAELDVSPKSSIRGSLLMINSKVTSSSSRERA